jgi:ArsR family transcriptional regulator
MTIIQNHSHLIALAGLLNSLSDSSRLAIVHELSRGEARIADLVPRLGLAQSTISAHVGYLKEARLVYGRSEGRQIFYSLAYPEVLHLLQDAERILTLTDNETECSVFRGGIQ